MLLERRILPATYVVVNTADSGPGSLRQAILDSDANAGLNAIDFSIGAVGSQQTIDVLSALPNITNPVLLDGLSQGGAGYSGAPLVEINGSSSGGAAQGLYLDTGSDGSTINGLDVDGFSTGFGILIYSSDNTIQSCYVGLDLAGTAASPDEKGIQINFGESTPTVGNTIGGPVAADRNVISGNTSFGMTIVGAGAADNLVEGNYIGTDYTGTMTISNGYGVFLDYSGGGNTIGGATATPGTGAGNLISGNSYGIDTQNGESGDTIEGNAIGLSSAGTALANITAGIDLFDSSSIQVGGPGARDANVISGNHLNGPVGEGQGVLIDGGSDMLVEGNRIGTNLGGSAAVPNDIGVEITDSSSGNTIGGTVAGARNVISGNTTVGVEISTSGSTSNVIEGDYIGTDVTGTVAESDSFAIELEGTGGGNTIGGATSTPGTGAGNLISGDAVAIYALDETGGDSILGNILGVGTLPGGGTSPADSSGLQATSDVDLQIGGPVAQDRNVISGSAGGNGIEFDGGSGALIQGNLIGTNLDGTAAVPNDTGVDISDATDVTIGGIAAADRNVISGNDFGVVLAAGATGDIVEGDYIGVDETGDVPLGNNEYGIWLIDGPSSDTIGGTMSGAGNVIGGNHAAGVDISGSGTTGNSVVGNLIGTNAGGTAALPNGDGVAVEAGATGNIVGGPASAAQEGVVPAAGLSQPSDLVLAPDGEIYIADLAGRAIDAYDPATGSVSVLSSGGLLTAPAELTLDGVGNLIVGNGDDGVTTGSVVRVSLATGAQALVSSGGLLGPPDGIAVDGAGNYIVSAYDGSSQYGNPGQLVKVDPNTGAQSAIGGPIDAVVEGVVVAPSGTIYLSVNTPPGASENGQILAVDPITGASTVVTSAPLDTFGSGLGLMPDGDLVWTVQAGTTSPYPGEIVDVNPTTGAETVIDSGGDMVDSVAAVAEPDGDLLVLNPLDEASPPPFAVVRVVPRPDANVISGNSEDGVEITDAGTTGNVVEGDSIGLDRSGTVALGNGTNGVEIANGAAMNTIGGPTSTAGTGAGNVIGANVQDGIHLTGTGTNKNVVEGNIVGESASGTVPVSGDVAWYKFADTTEDSVGVNNGTLIGGGQFVSGEVGVGLSLNGTGEVTTPLTVNYATGATFDLWFKTTAASGTLAADGGGFAGERGMALTIQGGNLVLQGSNGSGTLNFSIVGPSVDDGNFHYAAATWTGDASTNGVKLYLDGVLVGQGTAHSAIATGSQHFEMGGHDVLAYPKFTGVLDEVNVFDRPLAPSEVARIFNAGAEGQGYGNRLDGIQIDSSASRNTIGGATATARNVVGGNFAQGIQDDSSTTGNVFEANYVGVDLAGTSVVINAGYGLSSGGASDVVGGPTSDGQGNTDPGTAPGNVVLGYIDLAGTSSVVEGNIAGLDAAGTATLGDVSAVGILVVGANETVGGPSPADRNIISGDGDGVALTGAGATGDVVENNYIGTDITGTVAFGSVYDLYIVTVGTGDLIGAPGAGNLISGSTSYVFYTSQAPDLTIQGNRIGTNAAGTAALANAGGLYLDVVDGLQLGGTAAGAGNLISGNLGFGALIADTSGGSVQGNFIGTDATGMHAIPNGTDSNTALVLGRNASEITVGGTTASARNVISGNADYGIDLYGSGTFGNLVEGNYIGVDATGSAILRNGNFGVGVAESAHDNTIGGTSAGAGNVISGNSGPGVDIDGTGLPDYTPLYLKADGNANNSQAATPVGNAAIVGGVTYGPGVTGQAFQFHNAAGERVVDSNDPDFYLALNSVTLSAWINLNSLPGATPYVVASRSYSPTSENYGLYVNSAGELVLEWYDAGSFHTLTSTGAALGSRLGTFQQVAVTADGTNATFYVDGQAVGSSAMPAPLNYNQPGNLEIGGLSQGPNRFDGSIDELSITWYVLQSDEIARIYANDGAGTDLGGSGTERTTVLGNFIGTNSAGTAAIPNGNDGVLIDDAIGNTIGGSVAGSGNVIGGNTADGVLITGDHATGNAVEGDEVGTNLQGTLAIANDQDGVEIASGATGNTIGGVTGRAGTGPGNLISGNDVVAGPETNAAGVLIDGTGTDGNVVAGDLIGANAADTKALANYWGVVIASGASDNLVGGTASGAGNVIGGNAADGAWIINSGTDSNAVVGNLIGTERDGSTPMGNVDNGVEINSTGTGNLVGGTVAGSGNVIAASGQEGIYIYASPKVAVEGNYIGTNAVGASGLGNLGDGIGIQQDSPNVTIGGVNELNPDGTIKLLIGNVISGNHMTGIADGNTGTGLLVEGNLIGTDPTGDVRIGNSNYGILIGDSGNTIGGTVVGSGNVISGNGQVGVFIDGAGGAASGNTIERNRIGTNYAGTSAIADTAGDGTGVEIYDASGNTIGGTASGSGNVISGHVQWGISILAGSSGNMVEGNEVGTNALGTAALPDGGGVNPGTPSGGIDIDSSSGNIIGGSVAGAGNVISGNAQQGVIITGAGATSNLVEGDYIGTDATGKLALPNPVGVEITAGASGNTIGGTSGAATRDVISANSLYGVQTTSAANSNTIEGDYIGVDETGNAALPNQIGIWIETASNIIGGTAAGAGNILAGNDYTSTANAFTESQLLFWAGNVTGLAVHNLVAGNLIGLGAAGQALGTTDDAGIFINFDSGDNTIGGTTAASRNVVSADLNGISSDGPDELIEGNYVGTNVAGTATIGNGSNGSGVVIEGASDTIGGTVAAAGNLIGGNANGVWLLDGATDDLVEGNFIGTDPTGTINLRNSGGIYISSTGGGNTIGGVTATPGTGPGNLISYNAHNAINVYDETLADYILGNALVNNEANPSIGADGLVVQSDTGLQIGGMAPGDGNWISGNSGPGVLIETASTGTLVEGNLIGTNLAGNAVDPNGSGGVVIESGSTKNTIGGTASGALNVISGNTGAVGVEITGSGTTSNLVEGDYIGTDISGGAALGNNVGVEVDTSATGNTIGGTTPAARDVISGNALDGVLISGADDNVVEGDYIGTDATGTIGLETAGASFAAGGVLIYEASGNTIGGTTATPGTGTGDVISGNANVGVELDSAGSGNLIVGDLIGTDYTGENPLGNLLDTETGAAYGGFGVVIFDSGTGNVVGEVGGRNVISGNTNFNVEVQGTSDVLVQSNDIGTDLAGESSFATDGARPNAGLDISGGSGDTIGGIAATPGTGLGNVISGTYGSDLSLGFYGGPTGVLIEGNIIGADASGMHELYAINGTVVLNHDSDDNTIGGTVAGSANLISGQESGVGLGDIGFRDHSSDNTVEGNLIGTDITGEARIGQLAGDSYTQGVFIEEGSSGNTIGGTTPAARNVIAGFAGTGVIISDEGDYAVAAGTTSTGNVVEGDYIGTDKNGTKPLGMGTFVYGGGGGTVTGTGILVQSPANIIGGSVAGAGNVIADAAGPGVLIDGTLATGELVAGNYIGTDKTGAVAMGNNIGVEIYAGASGNTIGGTTVSARNVISGNTSDGVEIDGSDSNLVEGDYIGTDETGTVALGVVSAQINGGGVYLIDGSAGNTIGGLTATPGTGAGDVISGNTTGGVMLDGAGSGNLIAGDLIGTDYTGKLALGNLEAQGYLYGGFGVGFFSSPGNTVGEPGGRNVISANYFFDVYIYRSADDRVQSNYIGTDITGEGSFASEVTTTQAGLLVTDGTGATIGGVAATPGTGLGNVISGNGFVNVTIATDYAPTDVVATDILVEGNIIGADATGMRELPDQADLVLGGYTEGATIGGTVAGSANLISGAETYLSQGDLSFQGGSSDNLVEGNLIGTDITGEGRIGKLAGDEYTSGILLEEGSDDNTIGGTTASARNVIAGITGFGVYISDAGDYAQFSGLITTGNVIEGNYIGTDKLGTMPLGMLDYPPGSYLGTPIHGTGVVIEAPGNTVGGTAAGAGNVIADDASYGVEITDENVVSGGPNTIEEATGDAVIGNRIGTDYTGTVALGNGVGVEIDSGASKVLVESDTIAGNRGAGIIIAGTSTGDDFYADVVGGQLGLGNLGGGLVDPSAPITVGGTVAGLASYFLNNVGPGMFLGTAAASSSSVVDDSFGGNSGLAIAIGDGPSPPASPTAYPTSSPLYAPVITSSSIKSGVLDVTGYARPGAAIEFYAAQPDAHDDYGQGAQYLGTFVEGSSDDSDSTSGTGTEAGANAFRFSFVLPGSVTAGAEITAIAAGTASRASVSEFADDSTSTSGPIGPYTYAGGNATLLVGQTYSYQGIFGDNTTADVSGTVNYGDGSGTSSLTISPVQTNPLYFDDYSSTSTGSYQLSHVFDVAGVYTVTVTLADGQGFSTTYSLTVTVVPAPPTLNAGDIKLTPASDPSDASSPAIVAVGKAVALSGSFADPDAGDTHTVTVTWDDGSESTLPLAAGVFTFDVDHTYTIPSSVDAASGLYAVGVTVSNSEGLSAVLASGVYYAEVQDVPPSDLALTVSPPPGTPGGSTTVAPGGTVRLSGTFDVPVGAVEPYRVVVDWGDGSSSTETLDVGATEDASGRYVVAFSGLSHPYPARPAFESGTPYTITVSASDSYEPLSPATANASVAVVATPPPPPPSSTLSIALASSEIVEGGTASLSGTLSAAVPGDAHTLTIEWGDGASTSVPLAAGQATFSGITHPYADNSLGRPGDRFAITVLASDPSNVDLTPAEATSAIRVDDLAPTVSGLIVTDSEGLADLMPISEVVQGTTVFLSGKYTDPAGATFPETVTIDWGDGTTPTPAAVDPVHLTFLASHTYGDLASGSSQVDTITATAEDPAGALGSARTTLTIAAPPPVVAIRSGGFDQATGAPILDAPVTGGHPGDLDIKWTVDGTPVSASSTYTLPLSLATAGADTSHIVSVKATDTLTGLSSTFTAETDLLDIEDQYYTIPTPTSPVNAVFATDLAGGSIVSAEPLLFAAGGSIALSGGLPTTLPGTIPSTLPILFDGTGTDETFVGDAGDDTFYLHTDGSTAYGLGGDNLFVLTPNCTLTAVATSGSNTLDFSDSDFGVTFNLNETEGQEQDVQPATASHYVIVDDEDHPGTFSTLDCSNDGDDITAASGSTIVGGGGMDRVNFDSSGGAGVDGVTVDASSLGDSLVNMAGSTLDGLTYVGDAPASARSSGVDFTNDGTIGKPGDGGSSIDFDGDTAGTSFANNGNLAATAAINFDGDSAGVTFSNNAQATQMGAINFDGDSAGVTFNNNAQAIQMGAINFDGDTAGVNFNNNAQATQMGAVNFDGDSGGVTFNNNAQATQASLINFDGDTAGVNFANNGNITSASTINFDGDTAGVTFNNNAQAVQMGAVNFDGDSASVSFTNNAQATQMGAINFDGDTAGVSFTNNGQLSGATAINFDGDTAGVNFANNAQANQSVAINFDGDTAGVTFNNNAQATQAAAINFDGDTAGVTFNNNAQATQIGAINFDGDTAGVTFNNNAQAIQAGPLNFDGDSAGVSFNNSGNLAATSLINFDGDSAGVSFANSGEAAVLGVVNFDGDSAGVSFTNNGNLVATATINFDGDTAGASFNNNGQLSGTIAINFDGDTAGVTFNNNGQAVQMAVINFDGDGAGVTFNNNAQAVQMGAINFDGDGSGQAFDEADGATQSGSVDFEGQGNANTFISGGGATGSILFGGSGNSDLFWNRGTTASLVFTPGADSASATLANTGTIGSLVFDTSGTSASSITLDNGALVDNVLEPGTIGSITLEGGTGSTSLVNDGTVTGSIDLIGRANSGGSTTLVNQASGLVDGSIALQGDAGVDTLTNEGTVLGAMVDDAGVGQDTLINSGTASGLTYDGDPFAEPAPGSTVAFNRLLNTTAGLASIEFVGGGGGNLLDNEADGVGAIDLQANGPDNVLENFGDHFGRISLEGDADDSTLLNTGDGNAAGTSTIAFDEDEAPGAGLDSLLNSGSGLASIVMTGDGGSNLLVNTGSDLGSIADTGGALGGTLINSGSSIGSIVDQGAGSGPQAFRNDGTLSGPVTFTGAGGQDLFYNTGSIASLAYQGGTASDTLYNAGTIAPTGPAGPSSTIADRSGALDLLNEPGGSLGGLTIDAGGSLDFVNDGSLAGSTLDDAGAASSTFDSGPGSTLDDFTYDASPGHDDLQAYGAVDGLTFVAGSGGPSELDLYGPAMNKDITYIGGPGGDTLVIGADAGGVSGVTLYGSSGTDLLASDASQISDVSLVAGSGAATFDDLGAGGSGLSLICGSGADYFDDAADDVGDITVVGGSGADYLIGTGVDFGSLTLVGGTGTNVIDNTGAGTSTSTIVLIGGPGSNTLDNSGAGIGSITIEDGNTANAPDDGSDTLDNSGDDIGAIVARSNSGVLGVTNTGTGVGSIAVSAVGGSSSVTNSGGVGTLTFDAGSGDASLIDGGAGTTVSFSDEGSESAFVDSTAATTTTYLAGSVDSQVVIQAGATGAIALDGGSGSNDYTFEGSPQASVSIDQPAQADASTLSNKLDFSTYTGGGLDLDLMKTTPQPIAGGLTLTLVDGSGINQVVGTQYSNTILGNEQADVLDSEALPEPAVATGTVPPAPNAGKTQWVLLDFTTYDDPVVGMPARTYTPAEQAEIVSILQADYDPFGFVDVVDQASQIPPGAAYATLFFNRTPPDGSPGGESSEIDFGNLDPGGYASIQANGLLGGPGEPPLVGSGDADDFAILSAKIAAHELAHLLGVRHSDAFGPIGYGIYSTPGPGAFGPTYQGPDSAFESTDHIISTPDAEDTDRFNDLRPLDLGPRESIKIAFGEDGTIVQARSTPHDTLAAAMPFALEPLTVPNNDTTLPDIEQGMDFQVLAGAVSDAIGLDPTTGLADPNYYSFAGQKGDDFTIETESQELPSAIAAGTVVDTVIEVFDAAGRPVSYYGGIAENDDQFEGTDSLLDDVILPATGTYYVRVSSFAAPSGDPLYDPANPESPLNVNNTNSTLNPASPDYNAAAAASFIAAGQGKATGTYDLFIYRFSQSDPSASNVDNTLVARAPGSTLAGSTGSDDLSGPFGTATYIQGADTATVTATLAVGQTGLDISGTLGVADPSAGPGSIATIDYGDGSAVESWAPNATDSFAHAYQAPGHYVVTITYQLARGGSDVMTDPLTLDESEDPVATITSYPTGEVVEDAPTAFAASIQSPYVNTTYTATWTFTDLATGKATEAVEDVSSGAFSIVESFPTADAYSVALLVTNDVNPQLSAQATNSGTPRFTVVQALSTSVSLVFTSSNPTSSYAYTGAPFALASILTAVVVDANQDLVASPSLSYDYSQVNPDSTLTPLAGPPTDAGRYQLIVVYDGDATHIGSQSQPFPFAIARAAPSLDLTANTLAYTGQPYAGASVAAFGVGDAPLSATLTYFNSTGTPISDPTDAGSYTVEATYAGSTDYSAASKTLAFQITPAATTIGLSATGQATTQTTVTAKLQPVAAGTPAPSAGSVVFIDATTGATLGTATISASGVATLTVNIVAGGIHEIQAAYAGATDYQAGSGTLPLFEQPSIYVLNPTATGALSLSGSSTISVPGVVEVDSNSLAAVVTSGTSKVSASGVGIVGGYLASNSASFAVKPVKVASFADPLAQLPVPSASALRLPILGAIDLGGSSTLTIGPGVYSSISVGGDAALTMTPGVYVIAGGGFVVGGSASVTGQGVLIYNAGSNYEGASPGTFGGITLGGSGSVLLTPPTSGPYAGIAIFQSRDNTRALAFSGTATVGLGGGTVYAANALLDITTPPPAGSSASISPFVVNELLLSGSGSNELSADAISGGGNGEVDVAGQLLAGDVAVYVDDASGDLTRAELARIADAVAEANSVVEPLGDRVYEVGNPSLASTILSMAPESAIGGTSGQVLGCEAPGSITIVSGWDWYAGAIPSGIHADQYDFETVVLHELGHSLGLGHSPDPASVMYATLDPGQVKRTLVEADLDIPNLDPGPDGLHAAEAWSAPAIAPPTVAATVLVAPSGSAVALSSTLEPAPIPGASAVDALFADDPDATGPSPSPAVLTVEMPRAAGRYDLAIERLVEGSWYAPTEVAQDAGGVPDFYRREWWSADEGEETPTLTVGESASPPHPADVSRTDA